MPAKLGPVLNETANVTQQFGANPTYYKQYGFAGHEGIDLGIRENVIVASATAGNVLFAGDVGNNYGIHVIVWDADQNIKVLYAHLNSVNVKTGDNVQDGQQIGTTGITGKVFGSHLHFGAMRTIITGTGDWLSSGGTIQSPAPLNPNNGYKGWENPLDTSLFDWPKIWYDTIPLGSTTPSLPGDSVAVSSTGTNISWPLVFSILYAGWGETEALANFNIEFGGDINKLLAARGIDPNAPPPVKVARPAELKKTYYLIPSLGGLTLNQINSGIPLGRTDVLGGYLGVDPNTKLVAGQALSLTNFPTNYYPDSTEWIGYKKLVGLEPIGNPGNWFLKPQYANQSLRDINNNNSSILGRADVIANFLGVSEYYVIPGYQGFSTSGFPASYIPTSSEWVGFNKVFQQGAPTQPKAPTPAPAEEEAPIIPQPTLIIQPEPPPEVPGEPENTETPPTEPTPAGEGGVDFSEVNAKLDTIITKIAEVLAKLALSPGTAPSTPPPAETASGGLFVNSIPTRAGIYINGQFQYDYTPSNSTYQIKPGVYKLAVKKKGYKIWEQDIEIVKDETDFVSATLEAI